MKDKIIYVRPLKEYTTVSFSNRTYTFVPSEVYKYFPEYGTIQTDFGELYIGSDFNKHFRKLNWFELIKLIINFIF